VNAFYIFVITSCLQGLSSESFTYREFCSNTLVSIGYSYDIRERLDKTIKRTKDAEVKQRCKRIKQELVLHYIKSFEKVTLHSLPYEIYYKVTINGEEKIFFRYSTAIEAVGGYEHADKIMHFGRTANTKNYIKTINEEHKDWNAEKLLRHLENKLEEEDKPINPIPSKL
jgi:hypothetical protein